MRAFRLAAAGLKRLSHPFPSANHSPRAWALAGAVALASAATVVHCSNGNGSNGHHGNERSSSGNRQQKGINHASTASLLEDASVPPQFLEELYTAIDRSKIVLDIEELRARGKPWNSYHTIERIPWVIVSPSNTEEVSKIMKLCHKYRIPVTPFGGGTSLEGQTLSPDGGVSIDFANMKQVLRINRDDLDITVQSGLGYLELNELLLSEGLWFPLDPGPGASIGGMCACRCSGSTAVYYGTMKDNVVNVTVVMADGTVIKTANRARKSAAGYDLTRLFVGSEGTLGIMTEVTLRIHRKPSHAAALRVAFPTIRDAAAAARATLHAGVRVGRCELLDDVMMNIVNTANGYSYPVAPTLLFELVGSTQANVEEQLQTVKQIVVDNHAQQMELSTDPEMCAAIWKARKEALWSAQGTYPDCECMITDVCVPLSKLDDLITQSKEEIMKSPLACPIVAHAGDGNFHVFIMFRPDVPAEVDEAHRLSNFMVRKALAMDGTCTGEHGVGVGKVRYLKDELGADTVAAMAKVKQALDPHNLMNPGKVLEQRRDPQTGKLRVYCG